MEQKRIDSSQFQWKQNEPPIKAWTKMVQESIILHLLTRTLACMIPELWKAVWKHQIFQNKEKRVVVYEHFYTTKHKLVKVTDGKNSTVDIVTLATQPKNW